MNPDTNMIQQCWLDFRMKVISPGAPDIQVREMRLAFYAGFKSMLDLNMKLAELDEHRAVCLLEQLHQEARRFGASVSH
jgi:hypothetical protein